MLKIKLIARFYKGFFLADLLVTLTCVYLLSLYASDANKIIGILFWFKLITMIIILYSAVSYKKKELYYYKNLGLSKLQLSIFTSVFNFALWLILIISVY